jgi:FkbM family methyltransferase
MTSKQKWHLEKFTSEEITIEYPKTYHAFIKECLVYDVYRTDLLRKGDIVADLGAAIGEFTIKASKKVGSEGLVIAIEPNPEDFNLLCMNLETNGCDNVVPINKGVGSERAERDLSFWGRNFRAKIDTLGNIMKAIGLTKDIDFIKIDIEGAETDVAQIDIDILRKANAISIELHNTKSEIDKVLKANGFKFEPLSTIYCIKKLVKNTLLSHPGYLIDVIANSIKRDPLILCRVLLGQEIIEDPTQPHLLTGTYIKSNSTRMY